MRKALYLSLALAAMASACGRTPTESGNRTRIGLTPQTDEIPIDSGAARGGNLMGSGH